MLVLVFVGVLTLGLVLIHLFGSWLPVC
jgi:hypothetical protein